MSFEYQRKVTTKKSLLCLQKLANAWLTVLANKYQATAKEVPTFPLRRIQQIPDWTSSPVLLPWMWAWRWAWSRSRLRCRAGTSGRVGWRRRRRRWAGWRRRRRTAPRWAGSAWSRAAGSTCASWSGARARASSPPCRAGAAPAPPGEPSPKSVSCSGTPKGEGVPACRLLWADHWKLKFVACYYKRIRKILLNSLITINDFYVRTNTRVFSSFSSFIIGLEPSPSQEHKEGEQHQLEGVGEGPGVGKKICKDEWHCPSKLFSSMWRKNGHFDPK